jgi:hypothetical protein
MLPNVSHPVWKQIVSGERKVQTGLVSINLFIQSCKMSYNRDPSPENLDQLVSKMHGFFSRYQSAFTTEITQLSQ